MSVAAEVRIAPARAGDRDEVVALLESCALPPAGIDDHFPHAFVVARGDGDVINVASVSGKRPLVRRTPYCASKMAVIGLTSTLAFEVGPSGVNVNSLSPGPVDGPRMDRNFRLEAERSGSTYDEAVDTFVSRAALGRMVTETEVGAAVVAMLAMPGLCGADIDLSAGMVA